MSSPGTSERSGPPPGAGAPPAGKRGRQTATDMVRSLVLVAGVAVGILLLGASRQLLFPTGNNDKAIRTVDYANEVAAARRLAPRDIVAPEGLSAHWQATSVRFNPHGRAVDLHIGFVTPAKEYAEMDETTGEADTFLDTSLNKGSTVVGATSIDGRRWEQRRTAKGETALVRAHGRATVIVTGNASAAELQTLVTSLR